MILTPSQLSQAKLPNQGLSTQFGNAEKLVAKEAASAIKNLHIAEAIYNKGGKKLSGLNANVGGLSLEDLAGRFLTIFGVYLPQAYYSVKEKKHVIETNARNALVWAMTFAIYILMKNDNVGLNTVFNQFMKEKTDPAKLKQLIEKANTPEIKAQLAEQLKKAENQGFIGKLVNQLRLDHNYFDLLDDAGIKYSPADKQKMFWTKLDKNHSDKLAHVVDDIAAEISEKLKPHNMDINKLEHLVKSNAIDETNTALKELGKQFSKMKDIRRFLMRRGAFSLLNTAVITGTIIYLAGGLAMKIVLNTVAPLDHDFVPSKDQNFNNPIYKWVMKRRAEKLGNLQPEEKRTISIPETFNTPYPTQGYPVPPVPQPISNMVQRMSPQQQLQFQQALLKFQAASQPQTPRETP